LGLITGFTHFFTLIYWIVVAVGHYGNLDIFMSLCILVSLCVYLALYPALFSVLTAYYLRESRFPLTFMAAFWVGLEYIRGKFLTGFPWCLLGYTQFEHLNIIQISDLCGVYGVSFLIVLINGTIFYSLLGRRGKRRLFLTLEIIFTAIIAAAVLVYGCHRLSWANGEKESPQSLRTMIVQGNIDQSVKWDPAYQANTMEIYERLSLMGSEFRPELVVWPETSVPFFFQDGLKLSGKVFSIAEDLDAALLFGSPAYKQTGRAITYYNRAYLIRGNDRQIRYYDKVHLVPFGEYIPLKRLLFFVGQLVPGAGDFEPGTKIAPIEFKNVSIGTLICFEAIFPELARAYARAGANIFVNITNDAWFGMTSAPYQHLCMAAFRAVENRIPLIRAANTGFSTFIGPQGKIGQMSTLFREEILKARVQISRPFTPVSETYSSTYSSAFLP